MSLDRVVKKSKHGSQEVYNEYFCSGDLRLGIQLVMENDPHLSTWLGTWHNCWTGQQLSQEPSMSTEEALHESCNQEKIRSQAFEQMVEMLEAWSREPCTWGPSVQHLDSEISVLSLKGVLMFPEHLLSTILPRYGHTTTVEEVARLSAKGVKGDERYYRPKVFLFWFLTALVMQVAVWFTTLTNDDMRLVAVVALGVNGL